MPIGAEVIVQPALQPVCDMIFQQGVELLGRLTRVELKDKLVEGLERRLASINCVLEDANNQRTQSKVLQFWLEEHQDLALDIQDILDDLAIEAQEHEFNINTADHQDDDEEDGVAHGVINAVSNMVANISDTVVSTGMSTLTTLYNATISSDIQEKINDITTRLERLQSSTQPFKFVELTNKNVTLGSQQETSCFEAESNVFGRDEKKQKIITRLLNDDGDLSNETYVVIPIVGSGGIGKTTLARWVYNDEKVQAHFDLMAWVCVSNDFDVKRITITIVNEATANGTLDQSSSLNAAQTQLMQILKGNKFLIVLDDVWNCTNRWQDLKTPFKYAAKGSRVIMTTRNEDDAMTMISCPTRDTIISLKGLSEDDCWNLFQQHANNNSDLVQMRGDIVKKCKGLPLAAKALGGLFKKTVDKSQHRMILDSNKWSEKSGVLPVLRLSYDYMPSHLKHAFAYLSLFPKDRVFNKEEVILLWMAQGFLSNDEHMEDLGQNYFIDLESRSLLEQWSKPMRSVLDYGNELFSSLKQRNDQMEDLGQNESRGFIMHDLIHDLALWAASGICYGRDTKDMTRADRERIRHVFLTIDATSLLSQLNFSHLRTFYDGRVITNLDFIQRLSYVRALRLVSETIKVLPECIGKLKHLRFLSLKFKSIIELPESINCLWNLQTLELLDCINLKKVPYIGSLQKLRHMKIGRSLVEMPRGFEKLTNLKSLDYFVLADGYGSRIKELKNCNHLQGELTICGLKNVSKVEDAEEAQLHEKSGLDVLCLEWGTCEGQVDNKTVRDVVQQLKPATSIKEWKLDGYMGLNLPAWLGDPSFNNIVTIELVGSRNCVQLAPLDQLPCLKILYIMRMEGLKRLGVEFYGCSDPFPCLEQLFISECNSLEGDLASLGQLPCLKRLHIENMEGLKRVGVEFYGCSNPFPALEILKFVNLECWEKWEHNNTAFPCLQILLIFNCSSLKGDLPAFLPSLKTLLILLCKELSVTVSLPTLLLLEELTVNYCKSASITTEDVKQGVSEEGNTPTELVHLHLTNLSIDYCPGLISLPEHLILPALKRLEIRNCENMESLPSEMHKYTSLQSLYICNCPKLQCFAGGGLPENLKELEIHEDIKGVQHWGLHRLRSLEQLALTLGDVETEEDFNLSLPSSSLTKVKISGIHNLKNLRDVDGTNLNELNIRNCKRLESLVVANSTSLSRLSLKSCPKFQSLHLPPPKFISKIKLFDLGSFTDAIEQIPGPNLVLPSFLRELSIGGFKNLKTITCSTLPNLWSLRIDHCPNFESFGDTAQSALPSLLVSVHINDCELIKSHLQRDPDKGVVRLDGECERYSLC